MLVTEQVTSLHQHLEATAANVGVLRRALRRWLLDTVADDDVVDDLILATSEALENVVDHAYTGQPRPGTITLSAQVEDSGGDVAGSERRGVVIRVADQGRWQPPTADPGHRGRGLSLIAQLSDTHLLTPGEAGTTITLRQRC